MLIVDINEEIEICFVVVCFDLFGIEVGIIFDKVMMLLLFCGFGFEVFCGWLNDILGNGLWCVDVSDVELYL